MVSENGIEVDPDKVKAIVEWEAPKSVTEIRSFLGLAGYYRCFIENFSRISTLMTKLTWKGVKFERSEECENNFQELKKQLVLATVLTIPNGKANVVADALSRKAQTVSLSYLAISPQLIQEAILMDEILLYEGATLELEY
ncbi:uncharacterized mitochondrial protein AtMg00860-like [Macadamia integrifolia]|uniref:uncharacterized mitochondrial protein AtMg00860-like n=1 Tax=Macadamia integrifolia TaxID=60698 RepID=UPI001C4F0029|nr:uncharacterized mitochondrial protein AtMg00860-like [Macadamia integrifolia]